MSPSDKSEARLGRVLITEAELDARIHVLGQAIAHDYAKEGETERPILVGVLQGAFLFMADLIRRIPMDVSTDFISLASYGAGTSPSGVVRLQSDLSVSIERRPVLIVEDIVDTGLTMSYLKRALSARHPRSLRVCVLLDKIERRQVELDVDYIGFTIPNVFVVGYGMDWNGRYRNLPYVCALDDPGGR
ncbi:MAG: hypoxanthine phosphoribosyltransferase [Candidatus Rokuibacteriota bacterium]|jgi:hypoxanthine phosphoribosyltransferase|nr:MAG: hypoxanthine phosphoribosyltransferase [Candidatus Rokubacteria bacterium]